MRTSGFVSPALTQVDAVCARVLERAAPLHFGEIDAPADLEAALRLRLRAVVEKGWGSPGDFPDGLEHDDYDDGALHLGGWDREILVATARLVFPAAGRPLPTERAFELVVEPRGQVVDFGRLVVERSYRGSSLRVVAAVLSAAWFSIRARGLSSFCAVNTAAMIRLYRRAGFEIEVLGPARVYWGEVRFPVRFDLEAFAPALAERWG